MTVTPELPYRGLIGYGETSLILFLSTVASNNF